MSADQEVLAAAERRAAALAAADPDSLRALLHPEFSWISHTGRRFDRDGYIAANVGGPTRWHAQRITEAAVVVVGDTAVLRCVVEDDVAISDARTTFRMPVTQTWVLTTDGWRCLAGHAGPADASG